MPRIVAIIFLFCATAFAQRGDELAVKAEPVTAITHVIVIDVATGAARADQTVLISGAKITEVGAAAKVAVPKEATVVDGKGKFLIPGLWDMHVHMAGFTADAHWSKPLLGVLLANGITGIRDMGGNLPDLQYWRGEIEAGRLAGPRIFASGAVLDGSTNHMPESMAANTPVAARNAAAAVRAMGGDFVKILDRIPLDAYKELAVFSKEQKIPFVGHVPLEVGAALASDLGQKSIEHMSTFQLSCSAKEDELRKSLLEAQAKRDRAAIQKLNAEVISTYDVKRCEALFAKFKQNGTWQVPTQVWTLTMATIDKASPTDPNLNFLPASVTSDWSQENIAKAYDAQTRAFYQQRYDQGKKFVKMMNSAGVGLLAGSDSIDPYVFTGTSLHAELAIFVEEGLTPAQALATATKNPALFFGRDDFGTIDTGKSADLVLLTADPLKDIHNTTKIDSIFRAGKFYSRKDLDQMLEDAKKFAASYKP